jgi:hypothetical protein
MNLARVAFPSTLVLCGVLVLVLPIARHLRATGTTGVVFRKEADPFQRLMGVAMGVLVTGVTVWCGVLVPLLGTAAVGVWSAPPALAALGGALVAAGRTRRRSAASFRSSEDSLPEANRRAARGRRG